MTNKENWENINEEVQTTQEGEIIEVSDQVPEVDESAAADTEENVSDVTESPEGEVADENESEGDDDGSAEDDDSAEDEESEDGAVVSDAAAAKGMKTREKIILGVTGAVLLILLAWLIISLIYGTRYENNRFTGGDTSITEIDGTTSETNDGITDKDDDDEPTDSTTDPSVTDDDSDNDKSDKDDDSDKKDDITKGDDDNRKDPDDDKDSGDETEPNGGDNASKPDDEDENKDKDDKDDQNKNDNDNTASDYAGETEVRISTVNDDTGIITITIDGTSVVVPVQTTVFNGRVTKSGVAQGKLFGYNSGVTVMLYYSQADGFAMNSVSGYMNRSGNSLTILVDINGDGSKLMIKVNGMKSLM